MRAPARPRRGLLTTLVLVLAVAAPLAGCGNDADAQGADPQGADPQGVDAQERGRLSAGSDSIATTRERSAEHAAMPGGPTTFDRDSHDYYEHTRWYFSRLINQFHQVAFTGEYDGRRPRGRIIKWTGPLRLHITGIGSSTYFDEVERFAGTLARLTGTRIQLVNDRNWANVRINMLSKRQMAYIRPDQDCYAEVRFHETGFYIEQADVHITADDPVMRKHCIHEELTQIMGLTNDSTLQDVSIFNDFSRQTRLEREDRIMLVALYQPEIRPGMTADQAMPLIGRIMDRIIATCPVRVERLSC